MSEKGDTGVTSILANIRPLPIRPYRLVAFYVGGLIGIVAALIARPFSDLLVGLLMVWVGVFFAFSLVVFAVAYTIFGLVLYRLVSDRVRRLRFAKPASSKPSGLGSTGTWDRWMDGVGG